MLLCFFCSIWSFHYSDRVLGLMLFFHLIVFLFRFLENFLSFTYQASCRFFISTLVVQFPKALLCSLNAPIYKMQHPVSLSRLWALLHVFFSTHTPHFLQGLPAAKCLFHLYCSCKRLPIDVQKLSRLLTLKPGTQKAAWSRVCWKWVTWFTVGCVVYVIYLDCFIQESLLSVFLHLFSLFLMLLIYLFLALLGLCCCVGFSLAAASRGLLSSCGARVFHCSGFSCCRTDSRACGLL